jgi:hypothetical protein
MGVKMSYMGGIRRGGGVYFMGGPPCQDQRRGSFVNNFNCQLSCHFIWGSQFFSVSLWCNLFNRGGPSRLHPALYFFIRIPHIYLVIYCIVKRLLLYLVTSNIIVIFVCDYYSLHNTPHHSIQTLLCIRGSC